MIKTITLQCIDGHVAEVNVKEVKCISVAQWVNVDTNLNSNSIVKLIDGTQLKVTATIEELCARIKEAGYDTSRFYISQKRQMKYTDSFKWLEKAILVDTSRTADDKRNNHD